MKLYHNARFETLDPANPFARYILCDGATIAYVGNDKPEGEYDTHDLMGHLVTPGLIDCHTHLIYGGNRASEFEQRLQGVSYEEIAKAGGGIRSTVKATRASSTLYETAAKRLAYWLKQGVTTLEIKSGYGLNLETERKMLQTVRALAQNFAVDIKTTYLAAHALPADYDDKDTYIDDTNIWMKTLNNEGLIDAVDAFCEGIGFSPAQTRRVFETASRLNLPVKLHADQLSNLEGAALAASYNALSADHVEYLSDAGVDAMAKAQTVAVLLPGATYYIRETKHPPIQALRDKGVKIALATDHNPGSSPILSPLLIMNMAATLFRMTPDECLRGFTVNAAAALGLSDRGMLKAGLRADFAVWDVAHSNELTYYVGHNPHIATIYKGEIRDL
jgi:imidazolonepropionase